MASPTPNIAAAPDLTPDTYGREADSAYDSEVASYTTSIATGVTDYRYEHGRRYHAYKEGSYMYPNDEKENDRLDIMHKLMEVNYDGKIFLSPLKNPGRVLDIGTGTGIWAIEFGDQFPNADVLGNDLSPIQPRWVPPNVRFEIDDVEADWTYSQKFDFIHCRSMAVSIRDWPRLIRQCFEFTNPGGYCEFIDFDLGWTSPDGTLSPDGPSLKANGEFIKATRGAGMEPSPGPLFKDWVTAAGFTDVFHRTDTVPVGTWPKDKKLKEVGAWNFLQTMEGLEAFCYQIFTRMLGYTREEVEVLCAGIRAEIKDPKVHSMLQLHCVYGRVPEPEGKK